MNVGDLIRRLMPAGLGHSLPEEATALPPVDESGRIPHLTTGYHPTNPYKPSIGITGEHHGWDKMPLLSPKPFIPPRMIGHSPTMPVLGKPILPNEKTSVLDADSVISGLRSRS